MLRRPSEVLGEDLASGPSSRLQMEAASTSVSFAGAFRLTATVPPTFGIAALLRAFSLSGCCPQPSLVDLGRPVTAPPTRDRARPDHLARLA
jgi:hypothetical protein